MFRVDENVVGARKNRTIGLMFHVELMKTALALMIKWLKLADLQEEEVLVLYEIITYQIKQRYDYERGNIIILFREDHPQDDYIRPD